MNRLCFLFPDVERVRRAVGALHAVDITDSNIMVVARRDIPLRGLPSANIDATDALPGLKRGLAGGAALGAIAGIIVGFTSLGAYFGTTLSILWLTLIGGVIGGLGTLLAGSAFFSTRLEHFKNDIESGKVLLMTDVAEDRSDEVKHLVTTNFPDASFAGLEPPAPAIPPANSEEQQGPRAARR
jgi:hypothetical protein